MAAPRPRLPRPHPRRRRRSNSPSAASPAPASTASPAAPGQQGDALLPLQEQAGASIARCCAACSPLAAERLQAIAAARRRRPPTSSTARSPRIAAFIEEHAFFPAIMLREVAEGGAHLDRETLAALAAVPRAVRRRSSSTASPPASSARCIRSSPTSACSRRSCSISPARRSARSSRICTCIDMRALSPDDVRRSTLQESVRRSLARDAAGIRRG